MSNHYDNYPDDRRYPDERDRHHRAPPPPESVPRGEPQQPYGHELKQKKVSGKCLGGMVVAIIALILIFVFMSFPLYSISQTTEFEDSNTTFENKWEYDLNKMSLESKTNGFSNKTSFSYDDPMVKDAVKDVKDVMDYTYYFHLLAAIFLIIAIALIPIAALGKIPHVAGMVFLILAMVFILIIPIYFYFTLPPAIEKQFDEMSGDDKDNLTYNGEFMGESKGTSSDKDAKMNWGPEIGYWLTFVPLIMIVIAQAVYSSGKNDIPGKTYSGAPRGPPPPRDRDYGRPPPPRDRDYGRPPPPRRRDFGPPRPMGDGDYEYIGRPQKPPGQDYNYEQPSQPPRPPRPPRRQ